MGQYNAGVVVERSPCLPFETNVRPFGHHHIRAIPVRQGACESVRALTRHLFLPGAVLCLRIMPGTRRPETLPASMTSGSPRACP